MKYIIVLLIQLSVLNTVFSQNNIDTSIINRSRKSTLKINTPNGGSGTGFFIAYKGAIHIVTCYHVIGEIIKKSDSTLYGYYNNIKATTYNGDIIDIEFVSKHMVITNKKTNEYVFVVTEENVKYDYAILEVKNPQTLNNISYLDFSPENNNLYVGENIYYSGFPFGYEPMLTHTGIISGIKGEQIFLQSPVNHGNSGGALLNHKGDVIGIIDFKTVKNYFDYDSYTSRYNKDKLGSFFGYIDEKGNPHPFAGDNYNALLMKTLDDNLNTGIGGAINIQYAKDGFYK